MIAVAVVDESLSAGISFIAMTVAGVELATLDAPFPIGISGAGVETVAIGSGSGSGQYNSTWLSYAAVSFFKTSKSKAISMIFSSSVCRQTLDLEGNTGGIG